MVIFKLILFRWYGVIAAFSEGIAAQNAPQCKDRSDDNAPFLHGFESVGGAGGLIPAGSLGLEGRDEFPVEPHGEEVQGFQSAVSLCDE